MNNSKYQDYLLEISALLKEHLLRANQNWKQAQQSQTEFYDGYCYGLQRLMAVMQLQADFSGISLADIGLANIDPSNL